LQVTVLAISIGLPRDNSRMVAKPETGALADNFRVAVTWEGRTRRDRDGLHNESWSTPQSRPWLLL